jgi:general secretion pathway protein G
MTGWKGGNRRDRGFTLIELMIVMSLIAWCHLHSVYNTSICEPRSRCSNRICSDAIADLAVHAGQTEAPQSLDDLVQAGYIKQIPNDPMTGSNSSWTVDQEDS